MLKKEKEEIINKLADGLSKCSIAIATDYRGLTAKEMVKLRRTLHDQGIDYRVAKNTLTKLAADKAGKNKLEALLVGPLAIVFGYEDVIKTARVLNDYIRSSASVLKVKGGMLGDQILTPEQIVNLANMPPKGVLIAQLLSQLLNPLQSLHSVLSSPLRQLLHIINSRMQQLEGGEHVG